MLQVENEKVFIEHCQACSDHAWCTKHDESKYKSYFESCKGKILVSCPEVQVVANQIPLAFNSKFSEASKPWEGRHSYPRIGAFEIYFKDKIIFSKLESGLWPQSTIVADKIREILDQSKLPSKPREANNPEVLKKRNKNKIAPRYIKSIEPVSSRKETNRGKSFTPQRRVEAESYRTDLSEYKKNEKKDYSAREGKTDNEDSDDFKEDFSQLKKKFKDKSIEKTREITKVYELSLPGNCLSNKKINYLNKSKETCQFSLRSSDPINMIVKEAVVTILPGQSGKFQLRFPPVEKLKKQEYFLSVDNNGRPWECLKFAVTYE